MLAEQSRMKSIIRSTPLGPRHERYTQTNISLPMLKKVIMSREGICWVINDVLPEYCRPSPDEIVNLTECDMDIRVLNEMAELYEGGGPTTSQANRLPPFDESQQIFLPMSPTSSDAVIISQIMDTTKRGNEPNDQ